MKLKKYGYTLAEVLLAMALVGVLSAMVIPNFANNAIKSRNAATLGRAVRQIETGALAIIQNFNERIANNNSISYTDSLSVALQNTNGLAGQIRTLGLESNQNCVANIFTFNTTNAYNPGQGYRCYKFSKFQSEVLMNEININSLDTANQSISNIYIDTNGFNKRPNQLGKDVFWFTLYDNGKMVPHGSINNLSDANELANSYLTTCTRDNVVDGTTCAAAVVADGFKITYY